MICLFGSGVGILWVFGDISLEVVFEFFGDGVEVFYVVGVGDFFVFSFFGLVVCNILNVSKLFFFYVVLSVVGNVYLWVLVVG